MAKENRFEEGKGWEKNPGHFSPAKWKEEKEEEEFYKNFPPPSLFLVSGGVGEKMWAA